MFRYPGGLGVREREEDAGRRGRGGSGDAIGWTGVDGAISSWVTVGSRLVGGVAGAAPAGGAGTGRVATGGGWLTCAGGRLCTWVAAIAPTTAAATMMDAIARTRRRRRCAARGRDDGGRRSQTVVPSLPRRTTNVSAVTGL